MGDSRGPDRPEGLPVVRRGHRSVGGEGNINRVALNEVLRERGEERFRLYGMRNNGGIVREILGERLDDLFLLYLVYEAHPDELLAGVGEELRGGRHLSLRVERPDVHFYKEFLANADPVEGERLLVDRNCRGDVHPGDVQREGLRRQQQERQREEELSHPISPGCFGARALRLRYLIKSRTDLRGEGHRHRCCVSSRCDCLVVDQNILSKIGVFGLSES